MESIDARWLRPGLQKIGNEPVFLFTKLLLPYFLKIEVNHGLIRRVLPKGTGFNHLAQEDITQMINHINSYKRKKLNNRSPYETFSFYHGEEVLQKLRCSPVAADDILLKPVLLKK